MRWFLLPLLLLPGCAFMDAPTGPKRVTPYCLVVATHDTVIVRNGQPWRLQDTVKVCT